jgi:hypothetical protein
MPNQKKRFDDKKMGGQKNRQPAQVLSENAPPSPVSFFCHFPSAGMA